MGASSSVSTTTPSVPPPTSNAESISLKSSQNAAAMKSAAIRMIIKNSNETFLFPFFAIIENHKKKDVVRFFEELERLKKIVPPPQRGDDPNTSYEFKVILCTSRLLNDFLSDSHQNIVQDTFVTVALQPLLSYSEERVTNMKLHSLIGRCQKYLLEQLYPEIDEYTESPEYKEIRIQKDESLKSFFEQFDRCFHAMDGMTANTSISSKSHGSMMTKLTC